MHATQRLRSALASQSPSPSPRPSTDKTPATHARRFSLQGSPSPRPDALKNRPLSDLAITPRKEQVVRFNEQPSILSVEDPSSDNDTFSDTFSDIGSVDSTRRRRGTRKSPKPSTQHLLAYPPPRLRTKQRRFVHIRPRLLLQLQQLSADKRPKPTLDVMPSRVLTGTHIVPRLTKRCPELFRRRGHLGLDDLVVAKSEDFDSPEEHIDVKNLDKRHLVAVISPFTPSSNSDKNAKDQAEIVLTDGSVWTAKPFTNGFEFLHVDAHGNTKKARWVKKTRKQRWSTGPMNDVVAPAAVADYKFTFSMIDPSSRRHPVMATLTPSNLDILDHYTIPSPVANRRVAVRPFSPGVLEEEQEEEAAPAEATLHPVDEATRTLISITSIWVSLRHGQNWPTPTPAPLPLNTRQSSGSMERQRANTYPDGNTPPQMPSPNGSSVSVLPKRALSTGAAYMQRRQARLGHDSPPMVASLAESDENTDDAKVAKDAGKPGLYRRIRNWGHRLSTSGRKRAE